MTLLLLGATGRTGKWILEEALSRGHTVHAVVRDKAKCKTASPNLRLFEGIPTDASVLRQAITGCEAVVSALNVSRTSDFPWAALRTPETFLSDTMRVLIPLCEAQSVKRIIFTSAWGVGDSRKDIPFWFRWTIDGSNIRYAYADHQRQEELLRASNLNWTAVRPVGLTNGKAVKPVKTSLKNHPKPTLLISRRNLARFMAGQLTATDFIRKTPVVFQ